MGLFTTTPVELTIDGVLDQFQKAQKGLSDLEAQEQVKIDDATAAISTQQEILISATQTQAKAGRISENFKKLLEIESADEATDQVEVESAS